MMVDYSVDGNLDLWFTETNDFATVDGFDEFEQDLIIRINHELKNIVGRKNTSDTLTEKINAISTRIARRFGVLNSIERISVQELPNQPETLFLSIYYTTGESFEETF